MVNQLWIKKVMDSVTGTTARAIMFGFGCENIRKPILINTYHADSMQQGASKWKRALHDFVINVLL